MGDRQIGTISALKGPGLQDALTQSQSFLTKRPRGYKAGGQQRKLPGPPPKGEELNRILKDEQKPA